MLGHSLMKMPETTLIVIICLFHTMLCHIVIISAISYHIILLYYTFFDHMFLSCYVMIKMAESIRSSPSGGFEASTANALEIASIPSLPWGFSKQTPESPVFSLEITAGPMIFGRNMESTSLLNSWLADSPLFWCVQSNPQPSHRNLKIFQHPLYLCHWWGISAPVSTWRKRSLGQRGSCQVSKAGVEDCDTRKIHLQVLQIFQKPVPYWTWKSWNYSN